MGGSVWKNILFPGILAVLCVGLIGLNLLPAVRVAVQHFLKPADREVLATAQGKVIPGAPDVTVVKIERDDHIEIDIYSEENGNTKLLHSLPLTEKRDAYFEFAGQESNLVLADIDHDGILEIIAPVIDEFLIARLRVFKYDQETSNFQLMDSKTLPLK